MKGRWQVSNPRRRDALTVHDTKERLRIRMGDVTERIATDKGVHVRSSIGTPENSEHALGSREGGKGAFGKDTSRVSPSNGGKVVRAQANDLQRP